VAELVLIYTKPSNDYRLGNYPKKIDPTGKGYQRSYCTTNSKARSVKHAKSGTNLTCIPPLRLYRPQHHIDMVIGRIFGATGCGLISHEAFSSDSSGRMNGCEISLIIISPQKGHSLATASSNCDLSCENNI
jgi:hypothetical protein